jgi:hypothetical protein
MARLLCTGLGDGVPFGITRTGGRRISQRLKSEACDSESVIRSAAVPRLNCPDSQRLVECMQLT